MNRNLTMALALCAFSLAGCSDKTEDKKDFTSRVHLMDDKEIESYRTIAPERVQALNERARSENLQSPEEIMAVYAPKDPTAEGSYSQILQKIEKGEQVELRLVEEGRADDSVMGIKVVMSLIKKDGAWSVVSIQESYKCAAGRGHQDWSGALCQ